MGLFSKNTDRINMIIKASFDHVRQNFNSIFSWINYLNERNSEYEKKLAVNDKRLENVELYLSQIPNLNSQMSQILDLHYNYETVLKRLHSVEDKILHLGTENTSIQQPHVQEKIKVLEKRKEAIKSNLKEKMIRHITRNSKDYIRNSLFSLIKRYEKVSAFKLKEIIVEEQGLCSKSSFYRILEDLEKSEDIDTVREGKEKIFFIRIPVALRG